MDKKDFKAISSLKASPEAVERAVEAALKAEESGKVIELKKSKKFNYKPVSIIAASLVAVIACTAVFGDFGMKNSFTITASAVEATSDEATPDEKELSNDFIPIGKIKRAGGTGSGSTDNDGNWTYLDDSDIDVTAELHCKGNNIKYVSYNADDNGAIGLFTDKKLIKHSKPMKTFQGTSITANGVSIRYYKSVTSKFDNQLEKALFTFHKDFTVDDQSVVLKYHNEGTSKKRYSDEENNYFWEEPYFKDTTDKATVEEISGYVTDYMNFMLRGQHINVTVTYKDGSKETKKLVMKAKCVPRVANYKDWDNTTHVDKYGDKDVYFFDKIEISAKIED